MKKYIVFFLTLFLVTSCGTQVPEDQASTQTISKNTEIQSQQGKIQVTSSIIPISSIINSVGGDYVEVNTLVPAGVSPHGFDISAQQMVKISESKIVFMIGLEAIDGFLKKAAPEKKQVHLADGMELLKADAHSHDDENQHEEHEEEGERHDEDEIHNEVEESHTDEHHEEEHAHDTDSHVWLGKENITLIAQKVRDELSLILPEQALYFSQNTEKFIIELEQIYTDFEEKTAGKSPREFIVFHDAYNYLMQSVGMDLGLRIPFSENVLHETGTAHRAELIEEIELHGVKHVFREPQFSDGNLQKFANEYNLTIGILDPLGNDESASGYFQNLRNNLNSLSLVYE